MTLRPIDTNVVSFVMNSHTLLAAYRPHMVRRNLAVSFQTVAELWAGAELARWGPARRAALATTLERYAILHSDEATCARWAEVRAARRTQPIAVADAWIAATALAHDLELVTHNPSDFRGIPGLSVITETP